MKYHLGSEEQLTLPGLADQEERVPAVPSLKRKAPAKPASELAAIPYLVLDLSCGHVDLFGSHYWELRSPYREGELFLNTGPAPREPVRTSLSDILEPTPAQKYYLSQTACLGILRRAKERSKELPHQLKVALTAQAGLARQVKKLEFTPGELAVAFAANQRDEVRDLHDVAGALSAQPGMKQQTFVAGFSAGAGASAGSIAYSEQIAPTLKGSASGNCMPSILCLNDQGGSIMECSENISGTLRAQEHGHQPLVLSEGPDLYENHGIDARYRGPLSVAPTLPARAGTGGNNLSLVAQPKPASSRQVYARPRSDAFRETDTAGTQSARQSKDATDVVLEQPFLIRRLVPIECERLQGYPDGWTDVPGASDSARYRALGNSVAIPCVEYIMRRITKAFGHCFLGWQKQVSSWSLTTPTAWRNE